MAWISCPGCPVVAVLPRLSCLSCVIPAVLICHVLAVLKSLYSYDCPVTVVLSQLSCPDCPVPPASPVVLSPLSNHCCHILIAGLSVCPGCPDSDVLSLLSCLLCQVLVVLSRLTCRPTSPGNLSPLSFPGCPVFEVLSQLSSPTCPVPVVSCPSCHYSVPFILSRFLMSL